MLYRTPSGGFTLLLCLELVMCKTKIEHLDNSNQRLDLIKRSIGKAQQDRGRMGGTAADLRFRPCHTWGRWTRPGQSSSTPCITVLKAQQHGAREWPQHTVNTRLELESRLVVFPVSESTPGCCVLERKLLLPCGQCDFQLPELGFVSGDSYFEEGHTFCFSFWLDHLPWP